MRNLIKDLSDHDRAILIGGAESDPDEDHFVSEWSSSSIFPADAGADELISALRAAYLLAHISIREIRAHTGLSQAAFAARYMIPRRSIENWESGSRECPSYVRRLLAIQTGAVPDVL